MPARYPIVWLMTDERMGDGLWRALRRLPPGGGVVFRHHDLSPEVRAKLFVAVRRRAHARGQVVLSARGRLPGADGVHGVLSRAAHDRREALAAVRAGARILFVSPLFATRSHPGAATLTVREAARIGRRLPVLRIALGGMDARRWRAARRLGFDGWAGIDAWLDRPCRGRSDRATTTP